MPGLSEALRVFEIHEGQCGVLLYTADALAAAFVVPHPDDYRELHPTLVLDHFGELVYQYALMMAPVDEFRTSITRDVNSLADLRAAAREQMDMWAEYNDTVMANALLDRDYTAERGYQMGDDFDLFVDFGCLHGIPMELRDGYAAAVTKTAAPGATLWIWGRMRQGVTGVSAEELIERFPEWDLVAAEEVAHDEIQAVPREIPPVQRRLREFMTSPRVPPAWRFRLTRHAG